MPKMVLLLLLSVCPTYSFSQTERTCNLKKTEFLPAAQTIPFVISPPELSIGPETTNSKLRIENTGSVPINALFVVVDYYSAGRYTLSASYYAATSKQAELFQPAAPLSPLFAWASSPLTISFLPGQKLTMTAASPILPIQCPDEARIAVVQTVFSQGLALDLRVPGWRSDPLLIRAKPWPLDELPKKRASMYVRLSIGETGEPRVLEMSDDDEALSDWLMDKIQTAWVFLPARYDGSPIASEEWVLVRFYPTGDGIGRAPIDWGISKLSVVDIVSKMSGKAYEMSYGGTPVIGAEKR
jgi:hypothetical protein